MELQKLDHAIKLKIVCKKEYRNKYYSNEKFKLLTKNLRYGTFQGFPRNYFLFHHMFNTFNIPANIESIVHAHAHVKPQSRNLSNNPTSVYENIFDTNIKKYCIESWTCQNSDDEVLQFYQEKKDRLVPKTTIDKCDVFYGIVLMDQKPSDETMTTCLNSILKTIQLGLKYAKKHCIVSFWGTVRYENILTLLANHYNVKIFKTYYNTVMAVLFTPNPSMDWRLSALIDRITKKQNVASFVESIPLEVQHIVDDIKFHNKMLSQNQNDEQRIVNALCDSTVPIHQYESLLKYYFEPIHEYLGPATLVHHRCRFIDSYLQQFNNKRFVFVGIPDLLNNMGKFYMTYVDYTYICIQNYRYSPHLLLKQFGTELQFTTIFENNSYVLIKKK